MLTINFVYIFHFIVLVYNYCGIIRIALDFHRVYILGDMSSNSLAALIMLIKGMVHNMNRIMLNGQPYRTLL